jgi:hypothetical protein
VYNSKHPPPFEASSLLFELNQHDRLVSSLVLVNPHICVNERITDIISAGPFVAGLKCNGNVFGGFSSFAWQRGTLQLIAIHLITLHNILEYMQVAIIQTEVADIVKINICFILKTFGHDCSLFFITGPGIAEELQYLPGANPADSTTG